MVDKKLRTDHDGPVDKVLPPFVRQKNIQDVILTTNLHQDEPKSDPIDPGALLKVRTPSGNYGPKPPHR